MTETQGLTGGQADDWTDDAAFDAEDEKALRYCGLMGHMFFLVVGPLGKRHVRGELTSVEHSRKMAAECTPEELPRIYEKVYNSRGLPRWQFKPRGLKDN